MIYKFSIDLYNSLPADKSVAPAMIEGHKHLVLTEAPIKIHIPRKSMNWDIVWAWTGYQGYCLISPRFQQMLEELNATGYVLRETNVKLGFEHSPADREYKQLIVTGWGGFASKKSGIRPIDSELGKHCFARCRKPELILDEEQWDGTDFFRVWPDFTFITQRVADLIIKQKLKHVNLTEAAKMSFYPYNRKVGFVASPLRLIFPEDRAKEIGEPLGIYWWE